MLEGMSRSQIVRGVAWYMVIAGVLSLCVAPLTLLASGVGLFGSMFGAAAVPFSDEASSELGIATAELAAVSGLLAVFSILGAIVAIGMLIVAVGLFQRRPWARMGTIIVLGLNVGISILQLFTGGGLGQLVWVLLGGFVVYLFYSDPGIRAELGG